MRQMEDLAVMEDKALAATLRETLTDLENITAILRRKGWYVWLTDSNERVVEPSLSAEIKRTVTTEETL